MGATMAFPVRVVSRPKALDGQSNGRLDPGVLKATPGQAGGPAVELVEPAARAWRALCAAANAAGHVLKISGPSSAYRTYQMQEFIFRQRYTTTPNGTVPRRWEGDLWYKKPGVAAAAVPGTSNHGWGLACDTGEERDGDAGTESVDAATVRWLTEHEERFGFSHEIQSEPWHIRYWAGDRIPSAVLAYELALRPGLPDLPLPVPTEDDDMPYKTIIIADGTHKGKVYMVTPQGPVWIVNATQLKAFQDGDIVSKDAPVVVNAKQLGEWIGAD